MLSILTSFMILGFSNGEDLGQEKIRQAWQNLEQQNQDKKTWMKDFGFLDLAEDYWLNPSAYTGNPKDVYAARDHFNRSLRHRTFSPQIWLPAFLNQWKAYSQRPIDALPLILEFIEWFLILSVWGISLCSLFYLFLWASPIAKDFPSIFKSATATRLAVVLSFILAIAFQSLPTWSLLASCLLIGYLRSPGFAFLSYILCATLWVYPSLRTLTLESAATASWVEAYEKGRTRIEYSKYSAAPLSAIQKAHWSDLNRDLAATRYWLEKSESSIEKRNLELILRSREESPASIIPDFESLRAQSPRQAILTFNLSQLQTKAQNLVEADRLRQEISAAEYASLLERSESRGDFLVPLPLGESSEILWKDLSMKINQVWTEANSRLLSIQALIIALLFLVGYFIRQRASGLCQFTGEPSPRLHTTESPFYLTGKSQAIKGARQQVDSAMRNYKLEVSSLISRWSWLVPDLKAIAHEGFLWSSYLWIVFLSGLFVYSISTKASHSLSRFFQIDVVYSLSNQSTFYVGLAVWALLYVLCLILNYRKGDR